MLVPQQRPLCRRCGALPAPVTTTCPFCGAPLALPWPNQPAGPSPRMPWPPISAVSRPTFTPLVVELLLNLLGIYGVGWLMLGNLAVGLVLLIGSLLLWLVVPLLAILTLGLGLLCLAPLALLAIPCNLLLLLALKRRGR